MIDHPRAAFGFRQSVRLRGGLVRSVLIGGLLAALGAGAPGPAAAETPLTRIAFSESYVGAARLHTRSARSMPAARAGGRLLVGLALGRGGGAPLDMTKIAVWAGEEAAGSSGFLCVDASTVDGRYAAKAIYRLNTQGALRKPVNLELNSAYQQELAAYQVGDLVLKATLAANCRAGSSGALAPAVTAGGDAPPQVLSAAINVSRGDATAWLERDGKAATEKARCRKIDIPIAKSHDCPITLGGAKGVFSLVVSVQSLTSPRPMTRRYAVIVP